MVKKGTAAACTLDLCMHAHTSVTLKSTFYENTLLFNPHSDPIWQYVECYPHFFRGNRYKDDNFPKTNQLISDKANTLYTK